jgi:hypothetical protein
MKERMPLEVTAASAPPQPTFELVIFVHFGGHDGGSASAPVERTGIAATAIMTASTNFLARQS